VGCVHGVATLEDLVRAALDVATNDDLVRHKKTREFIEHECKEAAAPCNELVSAITRERDKTEVKAARLQAELDRVLQISATEKRESEERERDSRSLLSDLTVALDSTRRKKSVTDRYHKKILKQMAAASTADRGHISRLYRLIGGLKRGYVQVDEEITAMRERCAALLIERDHFNRLYTLEGRERHKAQSRIKVLEDAATTAAKQIQELCEEAAGRARREVMETGTYVCGRLLLSPLTAPWSLVKTVVGLH
jgi:hypothetical protein